MTGQRLCSACQGELDHISQCEKDGHRDHHQGCCPAGSK